MPHQVSQFLLLQAFHVDIPKHRHYYTTLLISKKVRTFFFFFEKILISKLHYINEHKLIKTLSYKFRSLIFFIQLRSRLETFIEYRNYYSFRRSQFTNKPWWLTLTNNNEMEYFSLSLSLSLSIYIYIYKYPGKHITNLF